jgi:pimeloyl-ACP methyl ester carboxylesterase
MPHAQLAVVEGAGHQVPGDNPAGFQTALDAFLRDLQ